MDLDRFDRATPRLSIVVARFRSTGERTRTGRLDMARTIFQRLKRLQGMDPPKSAPMTEQGRPVRGGLSGARDHARPSSTRHDAMTNASTRQLGPKVLTLVSNR
jgi:hypothetical protein